MSKFGNVATDYNGRRYASKLEANTAQRLDLLRYAADQAERVVAWTSDKRDCRIRFGLANKWHVYTFDFRVDYADGRREWVEAKGVWAERDKWRLDACRDWCSRNGILLDVRVVYANREEVLR